MTFFLPGAVRWSKGCREEEASKMRRDLIELIFTVALDVFLAAFPPHAQLYRRASRMGYVLSGVASFTPAHEACRCGLRLPHSLCCPGGELGSVRRMKAPMNMVLSGLEQRLISAGSWQWVANS